MQKKKAAKKSVSQSVSPVRASVRQPVSQYCVCVFVSKCMAACKQVKQSNTEEFQCLKLYGLK